MVVLVCTHVCYVCAGNPAQQKNGCHGVIAVCRGCRVVRGANSHPVIPAAKLSFWHRTLSSEVQHCPEASIATKKNIIHHFLVYQDIQDKNKVLQNRPETNIYVHYKKAPLEYCRHPPCSTLTHQPVAVLQVVCARCISSLRVHFWWSQNAEINKPILEAIARWFVNQVTGVSQGRHVTIQLLGPFFWS